MRPFVHGFVDEFMKFASDSRSSVERKHGIRVLGSWTEPELDALGDTLGRLPPRLVRDNGAFKKVVRVPKLLNGPPSAPGHSMYRRHGKYKGTLVVFDKGVYDRSGKLDKVLFGKSVLHELSHSFDENPSGPFGEPPFITDYASTSAKEDWAESFAEYFLHRTILRKKAPAKAAAIASFLGE